MTINNEPVLREAFRLYADKGLDFVDSLLCSYSRIKGVQVETFDKKPKNGGLSVVIHDDTFEKYLTPDNP